MQKEGNVSLTKHHVDFLDPFCQWTRFLLLPFFRLRSFRRFFCRLPAAPLRPFLAISFRPAGRTFILVSSIGLSSLVNTVDGLAQSNFLNIRMAILNGGEFRCHGITNVGINLSFSSFLPMIRTFSDVLVLKFSQQWLTFMSVDLKIGRRIFLRSKPGFSFSTLPLRNVTFDFFTFFSFALTTAIN